MPYRRLRIAFSAICGVLCLLLILLWVRSYWWSDRVIDTVSREVELLSIRGQLRCSVQTRLPGKTPHPWRHVSHWIGDRSADTFNWFRHCPSLGWASHWPGNVFRVGHDNLLNSNSVGRHCYLFVSNAPRLRWRFSLRTLLIATTVVAVELGVVIWAAGS